MRRTCGRFPARECIVDLSPCEQFVHATGTSKPCIADGFQAFLLRQEQDDMDQILLIYHNNATGKPMSSSCLVCSALITKRFWHRREQGEGP